MGIHENGRLGDEVLRLAEMKSLAPILAALALVPLLLGGYVVAYLAMGDYHECHAPPFIGRTYRQPWAPAVFKPAALVESKLRGVEVEVARCNVCNGR